MIDNILKLFVKMHKIYEQPNIYGYIIIAAVLIVVLWLQYKTARKDGSDVEKGTEHYW